MKFYEFLKNKLEFPLCRLSKIFEAIFSAIGDLFDELCDDAYKLQKEFFPAYSTKLWMHAKDRGIFAFPNETEDGVKTRTVGAFIFYKNARLFSGIKYILDQYIKVTYVISFTPNEAFSYLIEVNAYLEDFERDVIRNVLNEYKMAHVRVYILAKDAYNSFIVGESFIGDIRI